MLSGQPAPPPAVVIRAHRPGDLGWVVSRHGAYYAEEYGWDASFEALVAGVAKEFIEKFDPKWEACWMAEIDGRPVGSVCLVKKSATVAKLRLLIVDPQARGHRIGTRLVDECITFARRAGYRKITLWTNSILDAARHLYEQAGFVRVEVAPPEHVFGKDLVFETWELDLRAHAMSEPASPSYVLGHDPRRTGAARTPGRRSTPRPPGRSSSPPASAPASACSTWAAAPATSACSSASWSVRRGGGGRGPRGRGRGHGAAAGGGARASPICTFVESELDALTSPRWTRWSGASC